MQEPEVRSQNKEKKEKKGIQEPGVYTSFLP